MSLLSDVTSWIYHLGDVSANTAAEIAVSDAGLVVVDYSTYTDGEPRPYTESELEDMRGADDKLIVSYISVGEAEDYRSYWDESWGNNPPDFLSAANPEWPDNYKVKFWEPEWQEIVFDYVRDIVDFGFNGLYLDIIDSYYFWNDVAPNTGIDYESAMADFVVDIRSVAEVRLVEIGATDRDFVVIGQNGEELVLQPHYLDAVDGIAKEDLAFYYQNGNENSFQEVPQGWYDGSTELLEAAEAAGVEVFVVEYMTKDRQIEYEGELDALHDYLTAADMPLYIAEDRDLTDFYEQPFAPAPPLPPESPEDPEPETPAEPELPPEPELETLAEPDTPQGPEQETPAEPEAPETPAEPEPPETPAEPEEPEIEEEEPAEPDQLPVPPAPFEPIDIRGLNLKGTRDADDIYGTVGNDTIQASGGSDMLSGEEGNDLLRGGGGLDDLYGGEGADILKGGRGHDYLSGDEGDDRLFGGKGHDEIVGGEGDDMMSGGAGWDLFYFDQFSGHDRITDFEVGRDQIALSDNPLEMLQTDDGILIRITEESSIRIDGLSLDDLEEDFFI